MSAVWDAVVAGAGTRPHVDCQKIQGEVYIKEVSQKKENCILPRVGFKGFIFGLKQNGRLRFSLTLPSITPNNIIVERIKHHLNAVNLR